MAAKKMFRGIKKGSGAAMPGTPQTASSGLQDNAAGSVPSPEGDGPVPQSHTFVMPLQAQQTHSAKPATKPNTKARHVPNSKQKHNNKPKPKDNAMNSGAQGAATKAPFGKTVASGTAV